ncbi:hypothetical protein B0H17DRAFT_1045535 [Mycena rosella]|uniref:DUF6534 domain-containing protein n=1 Tax=Mycena rosella TaxID=1033263 RepID=A0AAD7GM33_MYCRO|nr:hypothetical protein B0H17DRAFT_1045535 [Mycena rosella]
MDAHDLQVWNGVLLAGSWANVSLFTVEVALCIFYMPQWKLRRTYQYGFAVLLMNDALGSICVCINLFMSMVQALDGSQWPIHTLLLSTALSAFIEQTFLLHRYWKITRNTIASAFIMLLVLAHVAASIACVALEIHHMDYISVGPNMARIAAILCTAADILIALSMVWSMSGINPVWSSTQQLIRSVCINALTSGAIVATVTLLAMVSLIVHNINASIFTLFFATMGRVYSITVLVNFIHRTRPTAQNSLHITDAAQTQSQPLSIVIFLDRERGDTDLRSVRSVQDSACVLETTSAHPPRPEAKSSAVVPEPHPRASYTV